MPSLVLLQACAAVAADSPQHESTKPRGEMVLWYRQPGEKWLERDAAFALAEENEDLVGSVLDGFFPAPAAGNAADPVPSSRLWLADNQPVFPVTLTVHLPRAQQCDGVELVQTGWITEDDRAKNVAIDLLADDKTWKRATRGTLPNQTTCPPPSAPARHAIRRSSSTWSLYTSSGISRSSPERRAMKPICRAFCGLSAYATVLLAIGWLSAAEPKSSGPEALDYGVQSANWNDAQSVC